MVDLKGLFVFGMTVWMCGSTGCTRNPDLATGDPDQAALQALLHDDDLAQLTRRATPLTTAPPSGRWSFDDCAADHTQLADSTGNGNTAFRAVAAACAPGVQGQGVAIAQPEDIVYVPDQPSFAFSDGVTVGGWFKPSAITGTKTLFRKRDKGTSSFALVLTGGKFQFVINLGDGGAASVTAPTKAKLDVFQHVAASYDGAMLRLFVGGVEVSHAAVSGEIPIGAGPLLMGNDGSERRFSGVLDNAVFATHALGSDEILQLTCLAEPPTVTVPQALAPVALGTAAVLDIAITNHNPVAGCAPVRFTISTLNVGPVDLVPAPDQPALTDPIASGATGHVTVTATPHAPFAAGDTFPVAVTVSDPATGFSVFQVAEGAVADGGGSGQACVDPARELMVTRPSVVDDPVRTQVVAGSSDPRNGAWTFQRLMQDLAPTPDDAPAMVEDVLRSFEVPQVINGFVVAPRPNIEPLVLAAWPRTPDGRLDLAQAPLRLQAIVHRFDLRDLGHGNAGEGRFVFAFDLPGGGPPLAATLILEYKLPATTEAEVAAWAQQIHALGALPFGEGYNAALQAVTDRFAARGARPGAINGSALSALRSNELDFSSTGQWQMRQFALSATTGRLAPAPVERTPDASFNNTVALGSFIAANRDAIVAETHAVPATLDGAAFAAGAIGNDLTTWFAPGVDSEARDHFALNTCNGCHSLQETGTLFLQIVPRPPGGEATLSGFLTGITVPDPVTGAPRSFSDLARRRDDLAAVVCPASDVRAASLRRGISRVH